MSPTTCWVFWLNVVRLIRSGVKHPQYSAAWSKWHSVEDVSKLVDFESSQLITSLSWCVQWTQNSLKSVTIRYICFSSCQFPEARELPELLHRKHSLAPSVSVLNIPHIWQLLAPVLTSRRNLHLWASACFLPASLSYLHHLANLLESRPVEMVSSDSDVLFLAPTREKKGQLVRDYRVLDTRGFQCQKFKFLVKLHLFVVHWSYYSGCKAPSLEMDSVFSCFILVCWFCTLDADWFAAWWRSLLLLITCEVQWAAEEQMGALFA